MTTITVHLVASNGTRHTLDAPVAQSLMRAGVAAGLDGIKADCGGMMTCATCHVYVDDAWSARLPPPSNDEEAMLEMTAAPHRSSNRYTTAVTLQPD